MPKPQERINRTQAAELLAVSVQTIRRYEKLGFLPFQTDERGKHWHSYKAVIKYLQRNQERKPKKTMPKNIMRKVFWMFEHDYSLTQIVIKTGRTPEYIRQLYHEYKTSLDAGERERLTEARQKTIAEAEKRRTPEADPLLDRLMADARKLTS